MKPPRATLRLLWVAARLFIVGFPCASLTHRINPARAGFGDEPTMLAAIVYAAVSFTIAALLTPANRGRAHRWLGSLGKTDTMEAEAACIAALIGGGDAAKALDDGARRFRALPLSALTASDLHRSSDSGLNAKTQAASLGDVDGFISHSWADDGDLKYSKLWRWAEDPSVRSDGAKHPLVWLDKACIDQDAIEINLRCLPVFLSGCRSLVVLAGPTYTSRLWCVVECFVWLRVGGAKERIQVHPLSSSVEETQALFAKFRASSARCYKPRDRQHLLAVIESGFGDLKPFDKLVRGVFSHAAGEQSKPRPEDLDDSEIQSI